MKLGAANRTTLEDLARETLQAAVVCDKQYTVKLTLPQSGKPYMRDDILSSLVDAGLSGKDILAVGPLNDNARWLVTLKDKDAVIKALSLVPIVKGHRARVFSLTSSIMQCRIHWLPVYVPMAEVVIHMCQYGVVQSCSWDYSKIPGFEHVRSTVRNIVLDIAPGTEVPSLDKIFFDGMDHKMLVTIQGCGPVCFRCQKIGHTRVNCTEIYCRHCQKYSQHISEECPTPESYANMAKAEPSRAEDTSDFPADNDDKTTTKDQATKKDQAETSQTSQSTQDPEEASGGVTAVGAGASPTGDWNTQSFENEAIMSDTEYTMASQTMYNMARDDDPDSFQSSDAGSMAMDMDGTASGRKSGSESDHGRKRKKKKHKGQGKVAARP